VDGEGEGHSGQAVVVFNLGHGGSKRTRRPEALLLWLGLPSEARGTGEGGKAVERCGVCGGVRGPFIAAERRTVDAVQRAPAVVRARRRPVEGCGYAAGCSGDRAGKVGWRGALGCVRGLGPAVNGLGRRTACASWRGRGVHGLVLVRAVGAAGNQRVRESEGGHGATRCGAATSDARRDMATCAKPPLSPASPRRLRPPYGLISGAS
jgi:hypothetical protein